MKVAGPTTTIPQILVSVITAVGVVIIGKLSSHQKPTDPRHATDNKPLLSSQAERYLAAQDALDFIYQIGKHERKVYSQFGEDGVLEYIFDNLGVTDKFYVEFGTEDCSECVTRHLWDEYGWNGVLIDGDGQSGDWRIIHNHFITAENMPVILSLYNVPQSFDFMCVDIDRNEYHIARSVFEAGFRPNVLIMEINRNFGPTESFVVKYNATEVWKRDDNFGQSALAAARLGQKYGYAAVYVDSVGVNMFFIKISRLQQYLVEHTGNKYTLQEIKLLLPNFETIYRRFPALMSLSLKDFRASFKAEDWEVVGPDGDIVVQ
ncbi:hypothetical protein HDU76_006003 [Blyttiomyces sp. JEL0837]|nr:hypothetical protein HDU76_006003 [Blyttiomyces sp. JEL0837]